MIEVNLYSIPASTNIKDVVSGKLMARSRYSKENMGVSILEFVKGFLKNNISDFDSILNNPGINDLINNNIVLTMRDLACINYCLSRVGFFVQIINVTDDEENPETIMPGVVEWNIIDNNFIQNDYPTALKIIPSDSMEASDVIKKVVNESGLFDVNKFSGVKNPFTSLIANLDSAKKMMGIIPYSVMTKIYDTLDQLGIKIFCATEN
jgi:hypothetical protein